MKKIMVTLLALLLVGLVSTTLMGCNGETPANEEVYEEEEQQKSNHLFELKQLINLNIFVAISPVSNTGLFLKDNLAVCKSL